jgi:hypothetical protein
MPANRYNFDVREGDRWGVDQTIRATWIVWLCNDPIASKKIAPNGISITGAKVDGEVDLSWLKMPFPFRADECYFTDRLYLRGASLRSLALNSAYIKGDYDFSLDGDGLTLEGDVDFSYMEAGESVRLRNASIAGNLISTNAHYHVAEKFAARLPALDLSSARIGSSVELEAARAEGEVRFDNAEIRGDLICRGANFGIAGRHMYVLAFTGTSMKVTGDVVFSESNLIDPGNFIANGPIVINRATIGGILDCRLAKVQMDVETQSNSSPVISPASSPEIKALDATAAKIDGDVFIGINVNGDTIGSNAGRTLNFFAASIGGTFELSDKVSSSNVILDLRDAKAKILSNAATGWPDPGNLRLQGFVFGELGGQASLKPETQIEWLRLQSPFLGQPYEQMAMVFRNMGYQDESVKVSIAGNWDTGVIAVKSDFGSIVSTSMAMRRDLALWRYGKSFVDGWEWFQAVVQFSLCDLPWYFCFGPLIQYGYRPWNALFISFIFVFIGTIVFRFAAERRILVKKENDTDRRRRSGRLRYSRSDRNFSPLIYSLETFVPLVKLGSQNTGSLMRTY